MTVTPDPPPLPTVPRGAADSIQAGPVTFEVAPERPIQQFFGVRARNRGVLEIELVLPVDVRQFGVFQHTALLRHVRERPKVVKSCPWRIGKLLARSVESFPRVLNVPRGK